MNDCFLIRLLCCLFLICAFPQFSESAPPDTLKELPYKKFMAPGLIYQGKNYQEANYNKICETPDGRIWFSGGDHDGSDRTWRKERYDRPWGFGNATVCWYDPRTDTVGLAFEVDAASALYSNLETPGHGKIHSGIVADSWGNFYTAGYLGNSYSHWQTQSYFPKSYPGSAILKYNPKTRTLSYLGIPCPYGSIISLCLDEKRSTIHGISVERCRYWRLNLETREMKLYEIAREGYNSNTLIVDSKGCCYFVNEFRGLTKFNPDSESFTDLDVVLPPDTKEDLTSLRGFVITSHDVVYGITYSGMFWKCDLHSGKVTGFGHILGMPGETSYNPGFALDESWGRIYFLADTEYNSKIQGKKKVLAIFDMKKEKFYYAGLMDINKVCYGAMAARDHSVYFCVSTWETDRNGNYVKPPQEGFENMYDTSNQKMMRPYLVKYVPPKSLDGLADKLN